jgi:putative transposase
LKIRLYPSKELHKVWKRWLSAYRYYYNQCISYLHNNYDTTTKVKISAEELDKIAQKIDVPEWVKTLPKD